MNRQEKLRRYDNTMAVIVVLAVAAMLLASCSTQRGATHRDPVKTPDNYVKGGSRNCGWAYN